jgi:RHS repeat-associated protein
VSVTDPNSNTLRYDYDVRDQLIAITDPLSNTVRYEYDGNGNRTAMLDATGNTTRYDYDARNRLVAVTDPLSNTTRYEYDPNDNRTTVIDPYGRVTRYVYDAANQLVSVTDPLTNVMRYEYDRVGNRTAMVNARGYRTTYVHNATNQLISETDPRNNTTHYTYDENGNRLTVQDANGSTTTWVYDELNRIKQVSYPAAGGTPANDILFTYDAVGNRIAMTDTTGVTTFTYDALSRLRSLRSPRGQTVSYLYDPAGNRTRITYPDGSQVNYTYDAANRIASVTDALGTTRYTYNARGQRDAVRFANGVATRYYYDDAGQVSDILTTSPISGKLLAVSYLYDQVGNRIQMANDEGMTNYSYDALDRLTAVAYPDGTFQQFGFDPSGNRTVLTDTLGITRYTYDDADRLTRLTPPNGSPVDFTWDANGNMLSRSDGASYTWDAANRLTKVVNANGTVEFAYDGDGRRTSKTVNGTTTTYLWDTVTGLPVILNESVGDVSTRYTYGGDLLAMEQPDGSRSYYHSDALGSVRAMSASDSTSRAAYRYDAYGNPRMITGGAANLFRYTGQQLDAETGLYYLRARYYDSLLGSFISRDPKLTLSGQAYVYGLNNPTRYVDPSGELVPVALFAVCGIGATFGTAAYFVDPENNPSLSWQTTREALGAGLGGCANSTVSTVSTLAGGPLGAIGGGGAGAYANRLVDDVVIGRVNSWESFSTTSQRALDEAREGMIWGGVTFRLSKSIQTIARYGDAQQVFNEVNGSLPSKGAWWRYFLDLHLKHTQALWLEGFNNAVYDSESVLYRALVRLRNSLQSPEAISQNSEQIEETPDHQDDTDLVDLIPGNSVSGSDAKGGLVIPGPVRVTGRSPNHPTPTEGPGAYNWFVAWDGLVPQVCIRDNGDPDGHAIVGYQFEVTGAPDYILSSVGGSRCYTAPNRGY